MWDIRTIPRVKMFDPVCVMCGEETETIDHLFLHNKIAKLVWYRSTLLEAFAMRYAHRIRFAGGRNRE